MEEQHKKDLQALNDKHQQDLLEIQRDYRKSFEELKAGVDDLRATVQQSIAITELKIENLTNEVREHNNFARRMPVIEEQIKVANHRIEDLERAGK